MIVDEYRMSNDAEALLRSKMSNVEFNDVAILKARDDFYLFRQQIRKDMIWGWWTQEVAWQLQRFYNDMVEGKRPKLAISAPPQHGKSLAATDFIASLLARCQTRKQSSDRTLMISGCAPTTIFSASS